MIGGEMMAGYTTKYVPTKSLSLDAGEIDDVIRIWSEEGAILHSVIPKVDEGSTEGYIIVLEITDVE
jgi:hypothetical protein